jgi:hypothetical protein
LPGPSRCLHSCPCSISRRLPVSSISQLWVHRPLSVHFTALVLPFCVRVYSLWPDSLAVLLFSQFSGSSVPSPFLVPLLHPLLLLECAAAFCSSLSIFRSGVHLAFFVRPAAPALRFRVQVCSLRPDPLELLLRSHCFPLSPPARAVSRHPA